ncbi:BRO family protein [Clostridium tertium]|uniref:BRO-N domain-containing protein n=1 Tax=Clostridium tertium TaxID=1559 RepID=UPI002A7EF77D|nr:BRO family protein [Clostridium tertium]MDY4604842.1 BRO family protein [Clostridium tertium]
MNKEIQIFKNEKLNQSLRTMLNDNGDISVNLEDATYGLGMVKIDRKNGKEYTRANIQGVKKHLRSFGIDSSELTKEDYIPESAVYLLAMKADNKVAQEFQKWLAVEVIPSIRKTGSYTNNKEKSKSDNSLKEKEIEARLKNARAREANILLKICNNPNLPKEYVQVLQSKATEIITGQAILPLPVVERKTYSATEIGNELGISANKVGSLANKHNLKTDKYGKLYYDKSKYSNKEVETFRYYDNVIPVLAEILSNEKAS